MARKRLPGQPQAIRRHFHRDIIFPAIKQSSDLFRKYLAPRTPTLHSGQSLLRKVEENHRESKKHDEASSDRPFIYEERTTGRRCSTLGAALLSGGKLAFGQNSSGSLTKGDAAILRFLAAAELFESDLWTQYAALAALIPSQLPPGANPVPAEEQLPGSLLNFDGNAAQYITNNTLVKEIRGVFLNGYLESEDSLTSTRRHLYETNAGL